MCYPNQLSGFTEFRFAQKSTIVPIRSLLSYERCDTDRRASFTHVRVSRGEARGIGHYKFRTIVRDRSIGRPSGTARPNRTPDDRDASRRSACLISRMLVRSGTPVNWLARIIVTRRVAAARDGEICAWNGRHVRHACHAWRAGVKITTT